MESENSVMTPYDVAKETHSSLRFIYKQLKCGAIPHVKLGDKYLIGREAFLKWANSNSGSKK
jgi:excisionase family DNA binding protein